MQWHLSRVTTILKQRFTITRKLSTHIASVVLTLFTFTLLRQLQTVGGCPTQYMIGSWMDAESLSDSVRAEAVKAAGREEGLVQLLVNTAHASL